MLDHPTVSAVSRKLHARSAVLLLSLENRLPRIIGIWLVLAALACAGRIAIGPIAPARVDIVPYLLLVFAPAASLMLALYWFRDGQAMPQPGTRLARIGRWRDVSQQEARAHPLYGTSGIMVSLLVGMLLNVPVRAAEYLATMPAISPTVPGWLSTLHFMMTADVVLLSSLYVVAFAAAFRKVPLFPRFLVFVWAVDLTMQLLIAEAAARSGVPSLIAMPLQDFIQGNIKKVLISVALWLPYLILSTRVNVTYRNRVPA